MRCAVRLLAEHIGNAICGHAAAWDGMAKGFWEWWWAEEEEEVPKEHILPLKT